MRKNKNNLFVKKYTPEMDDFLRENISKMSYKKLTSALNMEFGTDFTEQGVTTRCSKVLGIKRGVNNGSFTTERVRRNLCLPIGTERVKNGVVVVKVSNDYSNDGTTKVRDNWKLKSHVLYERYYRPLKKNEIVLHLDGNNFNFEKENLYAVERSVHLNMRKSHFFGASEITKVGALYWQHHEVIKRLENKKNPTTAATIAGLRKNI